MLTDLPCAHLILGSGMLCYPVVLILLWKLCGFPIIPQRPRNKLEIPIFLISIHVLVTPALLGMTRVCGCYQGVHVCLYSVHVHICTLCE